MAAAIAAVFAVASALAENIDPDNVDAQYAWGENVGWINAEPQGNVGPGVQVSGMWLTGFMWGENIGWINLHCQNSDPNFNDICLISNTSYYGVYNNGIGGLRGYAWGENVGWISFSCQNVPSTCASTGNYGVSIDPVTGIWSGTAWGENIGWINFSHNQVGNRVKTAPDGDGLTYPAQDNCPFDNNPAQTNTDAANTALGLPGADTLGDACDPDDDGDGCHDLEENGTVPDPDPGVEPEFGGDRNNLFPWDFFDVTGDSAIDLADTLAILAHFGELPGDAAYSPRYDRAPGAQPYQTQPAGAANIGIDLGDALLNLQSFGHSCAGPL